MSETALQRLKMAMVAGESSGDQLASVLVRAAQQNHQDVQAWGIAGQKMKQAGVDAWWPSDRLAMRGIFEPIKHLPELLSMRKSFVERSVDMRPDFFVGIDAPDFNFGVEAMFKKRGVKTMHYVSPSIWAWRPKRIHKIKAVVDHMLLIFPFEQDIYQQANIPHTYVGHPFASEISMHIDRMAAKQKLNLSDQFALALLPGSRQSEFDYLARDFLLAAQLFRKKWGHDIQVLIPLAQPVFKAQLQKLIEQLTPDLNIHLYAGQARDVMAAADATLVASGTASLEVALFKAPSVISYKTSWLSAKIYPHVVLQPWIGLPNILLRQFFIPEVLQDMATPENLAVALIQEVNRYQRDPQVVQTLMAMHHSLIEDTNGKILEAIDVLLAK